MNLSANHVLACDDRGSYRLDAPHGTYIIGGFASSQKGLSKVETVWNDIKIRLCGTAKVELKWRDFFTDPESKANPLRLSPSPVARRLAALLALQDLLSQTEIVPMSARTRKPLAAESPYLTRPNHLGSRFLDARPLFTVLLALFANYLNESQALSGTVWHDRLGSEKEEATRQQDFADLLRSATADTSHLPPTGRQGLAKITPELHFFDSSKTPIIQVADFVTGPVWAAVEENAVFLQAFPQYYRKQYLVFLAP